MSFHHLKKTLAIVGCLVLLLTASQPMLAEHLEVYPSTGESSFSYDLRNLTDISFQGGNIVFNLVTGDSRAIPMKNLSELRFSENGISGIENVVEDECSFSVYPNPAVDVLNINIPGTLDFADISAAIYSVAGQLIWKTESMTSKSINVSSLKPGMYILTINKYTVKFIKK